MLSDYYTAHATDLNSLRPALSQIATTVLRSLRKCLIQRTNDEFVFHDAQGNKSVASETFKQIYCAGYHRALFDICQDVSAEIDGRESWKL